MLTKMRESKGFTLVELMIVVAIIGILAAVAVPYYQRYVSKARLTSLVMPSIHSTETNISTYYALRSTMPKLSVQESLNSFLRDADTYWVSVEKGDDNYRFKIHVNAWKSAPKDNNSKPLKALGTGDDVNFYAVARTGRNGNTLYWGYSGTLATELGL